jgi:hypothetical protein
MGHVNWFTFFDFVKNDISKQIWGSPSLLFNEYRRGGAVSLGVKRPRLEADHSPLSSAEFKNACSSVYTPPYVFMAWYLVKHRDNLYNEMIYNKDICNL